MDVPRASAMRPKTALGMLPALLALLVQLSAAMAVPPHPVADAFAAALAETICHADDGQTGPDAPVHHTMPDCAVCPVCQAVSHPPMLPAPPVASGALLRLAVRLSPVPASQPPVLASPFAPASARGPPTAI